MAWKPKKPEAPKEIEATVAPVTGTPVDELSDDDVIDLFKNFSISKPIRIPRDVLSPNFEYRWINKSKTSVFQRRRGVGWVPVRSDELPGLLRPGRRVEEVHMGTHVNADGHVALGDDLVLAKMPMRYAEALRAHQARINRDRIKAGKARFHAAGEVAGVSTFEK